jgi:hypothetical protein
MSVTVGRPKVSSTNRAGLIERSTLALPIRPLMSPPVAARMRRTTG